MTAPDRGGDSGDKAAGSLPEPTPADVRIFTWALALLGLLSLSVVLGTIAWRARRDREATRSERVVRQLVDFQLTERSGRTVMRSQMDDKILVVNFVFTGCSVSCFEISRRMAEVQERLRGRSDVQLVSITIDPRSDTPEVLAKFAKRLKADPERWLFLTGERDAVYRLIGESFLKRSDADPTPDAIAADGMPGDFEHAERIAVVDRTGRVRCFFDGMKPHIADEIVEAVEEFGGKVAP
jgi:cytochrome oxidase Cu insertion factor (SCO1/SenC/PrrC family)